MADAVKQFDLEEHQTKFTGKRSPQAFDPKGGTGFDGRLDPHPKCPECSGDGTPEVFVADSRDLSPKGRLLFAGVEKTRDGIRVKLRDQDAALVNVARHLGMFSTNVVHAFEDESDMSTSCGVIIIPAKSAFSNAG